MPIRRLLGGAAGRLVSTAKRALRHRHYDRLDRQGLAPFVHISPAGPTLTRADARARFASGHFRVPNVSGFYHGILRAWWEHYGLGPTCLLLSETLAVGEAFHTRYPGTQFVTTDYYLDLQPHPTCDVVWDICDPAIPDGLRGFTSAICQATLEHILDPVQVMRNLRDVLTPGGLLYVQTHTPAFHYHGYPKDYLRYFPEWFTDVAPLIGGLALVELLCVDGHAFAVYRKDGAHSM